MNRIILTGTVTKEKPELKVYGEGENALSVTSFSLRVDATHANKDGKWESQFFNIKAKGKNAEKANKFFDKGSWMELDGSLEIESWIDKSSGQKREKYVVAANSISWVGPKMDLGEVVPPPSTAPIVEDGSDEPDPFDE